MGVRMPALLDSNFNEICRLNPSKLSAVINLTPLSTANMTLPEGEPYVGLWNWVSIYGTNNRHFGHFRVASEGAAIGTEQRLRLEHGIVTLDDYITPADTVLTGTPRAIITTLLGYQKAVRWQRGSVPNTGSYRLEVNKTGVLTALKNLLDMVNGYGLTYDFTTTPWTVNLVAMETEPSCECRESRNLINPPNVTRDDADFFTRVYAVGLPNGYLDADTVGTWGIKETDLGTPDDADPAEVRAYAEAFLREHKTPRISDEEEALDLAERTGESWDSLICGKLCRTPLPKYNTTVNERIISENHSDLIHAPERVKLSKCTRTRNISSSLAEMRRQTTTLTQTATSHGSGIRRNAKGNADLGTYIGELEGQVLLKAWGTTMEGRVGSVEVDLNGKEGVIGLKARMTDAEGGINSALIEINGAEGYIGLKARVANKVSKGEVAIELNAENDEVKIRASKINLSGYVTASQLSSAFSNISIGYATKWNVSELLWAYDANLRQMSLNGSRIGKSSLNVVTGVSATYETIHYDYGGASYHKNVITSLSRSTQSIDYLSY